MVKFELGRYYEHTAGKRMRMVALAQTRMFGTCLLAECRGDGTIKPCGMDSDAAVNWKEITSEEFKMSQNERKKERLLASD